MRLAEMMTIAMLAISLPEDWVDLLCTGGIGTTAHPFALGVLYQLLSTLR
jgi:hypothetical protein